MKFFRYLWLAIRTLVGLAGITTINLFFGVLKVLVEICEDCASMVKASARLAKAIHLSK